jgi:hypothetical protein
MNSVNYTLHLFFSSGWRTNSKDGSSVLVSCWAEEEEEESPQISQKEDVLFVCFLIRLFRSPF